MSVTDHDYLTGETFRADGAEIVRLLDAAQASRQFELSDARVAVEQCARRARTAGVLPEKLIIALKTLMREIALPEMRVWYRSVLTDRVIVWAIEAYYDITDEHQASDGRSHADSESR
jgi:hypothetical protein